MELLSLRSNLELLDMKVTRLSYSEAYKKSTMVANQIGISRMGRIERFVDSGIFVSQATRPNLLHHYKTGLNTGNQGKGYTFEHAYISTIMETAESFCAEPRTPRLIRGSYSELRKYHRIAEANHFYPRNQAHPDISSHEELMWAKALHYQTNEEVLIPAELVYLFLLPGLYGDGSNYPVSSGGLGAGFDPYTATVKAISELIEHHYQGLFLQFKVKIEGLYNSGKLLKLINATSEQFQNKYDTHFVALTIPRAKIDIPVILCLMGNSQNICSGWGADIDPLKAAQGAHLEAFQSWATNISGVRENMSDGSEKELFKSDVELFDKMWPNEKTLDFNDFCKRFSSSQKNKANRIKVLVNGLESNGFKNLYLVNLSRNGVDCSVVRAVVPGLNYKRMLPTDKVSKGINFRDLIGWQYLRNHKEG